MGLYEITKLNRAKETIKRVKSPIKWGKHLF